jgi:hypothetical protein
LVGYGLSGSRNEMALKWRGYNIEKRNGMAARNAARIGNVKCSMKRKYKIRKRTSQSHQSIDGAAQLNGYLI